MKQEQKQEIALMRYGAIAPLIAGLDEDYPSQNVFYEEVAARGIPGPDGRLRHSNYPRMSTAAIFRQFSANGSIALGEVSESTVCRFVNQSQLELRQTPNRDMRRYERPHINEVRCSDSSVGPRLVDANGKGKDQLQRY